MTPDQLKCIQLRDCFYAGYSMPQYCVDNGIKNPLIASYDPEFLWELSVQFCYDKRLQAKFCLLASGPVHVTHSVACTTSGQCFDRINFKKLEQHDKLLILTTNRFKELPVEKTIYFDVLLHNFIQYVYAERPLYEYIHLHKGIKVILTNVPVLKQDENNTEYEKCISQKSIHQVRAELEKRGETILETRFDQFGYTNDETHSILKLSDAKTNPDGTTKLLDNDAPLVKILGGKRQTAYQTGTYKNTIWCMGTCTYYGIGASYDRTFESFLQRIINEKGQVYLVENVSQFYAGRYQDIFYNMDRLPVKEGDIVLVCLQGLHAHGIPFFDTSAIFKRPHEYGEVFADNYHVNERGYKIIAEKAYKYLEENNFFKDYTYSIPDYFSPVHQYGIIHTHNMCMGGGYSIPA